MKDRYFHKFASILYRNSNRFYDRELARFGIGCGQQFFLLKVLENDGLSMFDLAGMGHFDKGTVTKACQKLEEQGYLTCEADPSDRRVRRMHVTDRGREVAAELYATRERWNDALTHGMTPEEVEQAERLLSRLAENAFRYMEELCGNE